jgi:excinuclease ABC subunit B
MTDSLEKAITETARRRSVQEEFNKEHGITPKSVTRKLEDDLRIADPLGIDGDDSVDDDQFPEPAEGNEPGIRPMEPLQPSSRRKTKDERRKKGSRSEVRGSRHDVRKEIPASAGMTSSLEDLERQMKEAAARLDFEEAARLRDIIRNMR